MDKLNKTFKKLQQTGSWYGFDILSVNDRNDSEDTPLHTFCTRGDLESVKVLLEAGADINAAGDQKGTPIFNAIISDNAELVEFLLKNGASQNNKIFGNCSPYEYAKSTNANLKILELLKK